MEYGETQMSVDWLESKIQNYLATYGTISPKMISVFAERAKAINKEQHRQTANVVRQAIFDLNYSSFDEYYNETYGGNNEQQ